jgi:hypothetical protein
MPLRKKLATQKAKIAALQQYDCTILVTCCRYFARQPTRPFPLAFRILYGSPRPVIESGLKAGKYYEE